MIIESGRIYKISEKDNLKQMKITSKIIFIKNTFKI